MIVAGHYIPLNPIQIDESYLKYLLEIVPSKITSFKIYLKLDLLLMIGVSFYLATISYTIYTNFQTIRNDNRIIKKNRTIEIMCYFVSLLALIYLGLEIGENLQLLSISRTFESSLDSSFFLKRTYLKFAIIITICILLFILAGYYCYLKCQLRQLNLKSFCFKFLTIVLSTFLAQVLLFIHDL